MKGLTEPEKKQYAAITNEWVFICECGGILYLKLNPPSAHCVLCGKIYNIKPSEEKPKQTLEKCFNCGEEFYLEEETIRYRVTAETIFKNEPVVTEYTLYFCDSGCFHQYEHGAEKHEERKML